MKTSKHLYVLVFLLFALTACNENTTQTTEKEKSEASEKADNSAVVLAFPALSPRAEVQQMIGITNVKINYSRPSVRDRVIWGELVPYDEVWRTGANAPTTIKFPHDVRVKGNAVKAGRYNLTTIPKATGEWTVILTEAGENVNDTLRFNVQSGASGQFFETMTIHFQNVGEDSGDVVLSWENLNVAFTVETETHRHVTTLVDKAIAQAGDDDWMVYSQSARYFIERGERMEEAEAWVNRSLEIEENWRNYFTKALLKEKQGEIQEAIEMIDKAIEQGRQEEGFGAEGFLLSVSERLKNQL